jgi:hypothetical protein
MNDIVHVLNHAKPILFADDSNLIFEHENLNQLTNIVNSELEKTAKWFILNKLSLNIEKTKFIIFHTQRKKIPDINPLVINRIPIEKVTEIKFLGVYIDEFLNWKYPLRIKNNQISRNLAIMNRLKNFIPLSTRKTLYHSLIIPHLSYGILAWGNSRSKESKHMKILQKRAVRFVVKASYNSHTSPIFNSQNILTIEDIFKLQCCKLYLKKQRSHLPLYLNNLLHTTDETHNYETRQQHHVRPSNISINLHYQLLSVKIAQVWNHLPNIIKLQSHQSIESFSNKFQQYLVEQYATTCEIRNCYVCTTTSPSNT